MGEDVPHGICQDWRALYGHVFVLRAAVPEAHLLLWIESCPPESYSRALTPSVMVLGDRPLRLNE